MNYANELEKLKNSIHLSYINMFLHFELSYTHSKFLHQHLILSRSRRPEVFCKKAVLRNFAKFIWKHLCQCLFFNKVAGLSPATLLKKRYWHMCFPVNVAKFLRTPFLTEHLRWLLLPIFTCDFNDTNLK